MESLTRLGRWIVGLLDRLGVIDRHRVTPTFDLAWPRVITGLARRSKQTADIAMVGWVLGPPGIAGLAFAYAYWQIGNQLSLGLSGGTISLVAQNYGGEETARAELAFKMSIWIAIALAVPLTVVLYLFATEIIRTLGAAPDTVEYGATYLRIASVALVFEYINKIASRAFAGVGDTFTPMLIRSGGAIINIVLNAVFIVGLGMGAAGAALGTVIATVTITLVFAWGFFGGSYPIGAAPSLRFRLRGPQFETELGRQLITISAPLVSRKLATSLVVFPLLSVAAVFGTIVVTALEVCRQVRGLMNSLNWGFAIASSTLVGQQLGSGDELEAEAYGWDIIRLAALCNVLLAVLVIAFSGPITDVFVSDPEALTTTTPFVVVGAISAVGLGIDRTTHGALRAGGDTRWPFYGRLIGLYVFTVPVAYLGIVTPLGILGLYLAVLFETYVSCGINVTRFSTNAWKSISREYRPQSTD
jgi:putative MATE family efflux protein